MGPNLNEARIISSGPEQQQQPKPQNGFGPNLSEASLVSSVPKPDQVTYAKPEENKGIIDTVSDYVTGKGGVEFEQLPELTELDFGVDGAGDLAGKSWTFLKSSLTTDEEEKGRILRSDYPEIFTDLRQDAKGKTLIKAIDKHGNEQWAYVNKAGFSTQDAIDLVAQGIQFIPAARIAGKAVTLAGRVGRGAAASAATDLAQQSAVIASDGKDNIDLGQTAITAAAGGVAEGVLPPLANKAGEMAKKVFNRADDATAQTTKETGNAGLEQVSDAAEDSVSFEVPLTRGQIADDLALLQKEEVLRNGGRGDAAQKMMRDFDDRQMNVISNHADDLQAEMGTGVGYDPDLAPNVQIGSKLQQNLQGAADTAKAEVREAYQIARDGKASLLREGVAEFSKNLKRSLFKKGHSLDAEHNKELKRLVGLIDSRLVNPNVTKISLNSVDNWRKQVNKAITKTASEPQDVALIEAKKQLDGYLDGAVTRGLLEGDEAVLRQLKKARLLRTEYARKFQKAHRDPTGQTMMKLLDDGQVAPEKVINTIMGVNTISRPHVAKGVAKRIGMIFGRESEEFKMLKDAFLIKAFTDTKGNLSKRMIAEKAKRMIREDGKSVAEELFNHAERRKILQFANQVGKTLQKPDATNPSRSGHLLMREMWQSGLIGIGNTTVGRLATKGVSEFPVVGPAMKEAFGENAAKKAISFEPQVKEYVERIQTHPWLEAGAMAAERVSPEGAKPHQIAYSAMSMPQEHQELLQQIREEREDLMREGRLLEAIRHRSSEELKIIGPEMIGGGMIKRIGKGARMRHVTPEANLKAGKEAAEKCLKNKEDVVDAMYRDDIGSISFYYGNEKAGIKHIEYGRTLKDHLNGEEYVLKRVPEVLAYGKLSRVYGPPNGRRADITYKKGRVSLSLYRFKERESWVVTAFEDW